jgi:hypothetical protein
MKPEAVMIIALSVLFFLIGVVTAGFFGWDAAFSTGFGGYADALLLCAAAFIFSVLLYGYMAPVFFLYLGTVNSTLIFWNPAAVIVQLAGLITAGYAGIIFSSYLKKDFEGDDNLFMHINEFALPLGIAVVVCLAAVAAAPFMPTGETLYNSLSGLF